MRRREKNEKQFSPWTKIDWRVPEQATRAKSGVPKVAWAGGARRRSPKCELELSAPSRKYSGLGQGYEAWRTRSSRPPDWLPRSAKGGSSAGSRIWSEGDVHCVIIMINRHPPVHIFAAIFGGLEKVKATCPVFLVSERSASRHKRGFGWQSHLAHRRWFRKHCTGGNLTDRLRDSHAAAFDSHFSTKICIRDPWHCARMGGNFSSDDLRDL